MEGRFGCDLRSKSFEAQATEGLLHVLVHNLLALLKAEEASTLIAWVLHVFTQTLKRTYGTTPLI